MTLARACDKPGDMAVNTKMCRYALDGLISHENEELRDRVTSLEKRVEHQEDEILCLKSALSDAIRRIASLENTKGNVCKCSMVHARHGYTGVHTVTSIQAKKTTYVRCRSPSPARVLSKPLRVASPRTGRVFCAWGPPPNYNRARPASRAGHEPPESPDSPQRWQSVERLPQGYSLDNVHTRAKSVDSLNRISPLTVHPTCTTRINNYKYDTSGPHHSGPDPRVQFSNHGNSEESFSRVQTSTVESAPSRFGKGPGYGTPGKGISPDQGYESPGNSFPAKGLGHPSQGYGYPDQSNNDPYSFILPEIPTGWDSRDSNDELDPIEEESFTTTKTTVVESSPPIQDAKFPEKTSQSPDINSVYKSRSTIARSSWGQKAKLSNDTDPEPKIAEKKKEPVAETPRRGFMSRFSSKPKEEPKPEPIVEPKKDEPQFTEPMILPTKTEPKKSEPNFFQFPEPDNRRKEEPKYPRSKDDNKPDSARVALVFVDSGKDKPDNEPKYEEPVKITKQEPRYQEPEIEPEPKKDRPRFFTRFAFSKPKEEPLVSPKKEEPAYEEPTIAPQKTEPKETVPLRFEPKEEPRRYSNNYSKPDDEPKFEPIVAPKKEEPRFQEPELSPIKTEPEKKQLDPEPIKETPRFFSRFGSKPKPEPIIAPKNEEPTQQEPLKSPNDSTSPKSPILRKSDHGHGLYTNAKSPTPHYPKTDKYADPEPAPKSPTKANEEPKSPVEEALSTRFRRFSRPLRFGNTPAKQTEEKAVEPESKPKEETTPANVILPVNDPSTENTIEASKPKMGFDRVALRRRSSQEPTRIRKPSHDTVEEDVIAAPEKRAVEESAPGEILAAPEKRDQEESAPPEKKSEYVPSWRRRSRDTPKEKAMEKEEPKEESPRRRSSGERRRSRDDKKPAPRVALVFVDSEQDKPDNDAFDEPDGSQPLRRESGPGLIYAENEAKEPKKYYEPEQEISKPVVVKLAESAPKHYYEPEPEMARPDKVKLDESTPNHEPEPEMARPDKVKPDETTPNQDWRDIRDNPDKSRPLQRASGPGLIFAENETRQPKKYYEPEPELARPVEVKPDESQPKQDRNKPVKRDSRPALIFVDSPTGEPKNYFQPEPEMTRPDKVKLDESTPNYEPEQEMARPDKVKLDETTPNQDWRDNRDNPDKSRPLQRASGPGLIFVENESREPKKYYEPEEEMARPVEVKPDETTPNEDPRDNRDEKKPVKRGAGPALIFVNSQPNEEEYPKEEEPMSREEEKEKEQSPEILGKENEDPEKKEEKRAAPAPSKTAVKTPPHKSSGRPSGGPPQHSRRTADSRSSPRSLTSPSGKKSLHNGPYEGMNGTSPSSKDPFFNKDDGTIKMFLKGRPVTMYMPSNVSELVDLNKAGLLPPSKLKLEWVYGYRGRDCRTNVYFLPTGEILYFVAAVVVLYNVEEQMQRHYLGHNDDVKCLAVHPDRITIASGQVAGHDKSAGKRCRPHVRVWNSVSLATLHIIGLGDFDRAVCCVSFSKADLEGRYLCVVDEGNEHTLSVWEWQVGEKGRKVTETKSSTEAVVSAEFHPLDKNTLVTCGKSQVIFWAFENGTLNKKAGVFDKYEKPKYILCLTFAENGDVVTGDSNGNLFIWGRGTNKISRAMLNAHEGGIFALCMLKDGSMLSGGGRDRKIVKWDGDFNRTGVETELPEHYGAVRTLSQGRGNMILAGTTRNAILQGTLSLEYSPIVQGHVDEVWGLAMHPNQHQFLTCAYDRLIYLWDALTHTVIWQKELNDTAHCACFYPEGDIVAIGSQNGRWFVLDTTSHDILAVHSDGNEQIECIQFSPDGQHLALGSRDNSIYVYSTTEGGRKFSRVGKCTGHSSFVTHLDWSEDGSCLTSNSGDHEILFWSANNCQVIHSASSMRDIKWKTQSCTLSINTCGIWPEGADGTDVNACCKSTSKTNLLASADDFGKVNLFQYPSMKPVSDGHSYGGHSSHVTNVTFLYDDSRLLSTGGRDTAIMQWEII